MKYLIILAFGMLFSCSKNNIDSEVIDTHVDIVVEDANGNNILSGASPIFINPDSIELMYLINGNTQSVRNKDLDCPNSVCYISDLGRERIRIFPNDSDKEEYPITYIKWGNGDFDTLKCHFVRKNNGNISSVVCDKVWFNDLPMIPDNAIVELGRAFRIIKH